jgi:hypothetical protein
MAAEDRPKLPRATLRDGKLYIKGEKEPYFRDRRNNIRLRIDALTIRRGYRDLRNRKDDLTESLGGIATIEKDEFAVIGLETEHTWQIEFLLRPVPEADTEYHWHASIGFNTHEGFEWWEMPDWEEGFFIEAYCTRSYLDDLLAAVRRGHVDNIRVVMETTMWTQAPPLMSGSPRTWCLACYGNSGVPGPTIENGYISSLIWEEKFGSHQTKDEAIEPKPQLVELPARVYSMLTALLAIAAALLVLTFLRH